MERTYVPDDTVISSENAAGACSEPSAAAGPGAASGSGAGAASDPASVSVSLACEASCVASADAVPCASSSTEAVGFVVSNACSRPAICRMRSKTSLSSDETSFSGARYACSPPGSHSTRRSSWTVTPRASIGRGNGVPSRAYSNRRLPSIRSALYSGGICCTSPVKRPSFARTMSSVTCAEGARRTTGSLQSYELVAEPSRPVVLYSFVQCRNCCSSFVAAFTPITA